MCHCYIITIAITIIVNIFTITAITTIIVSIITIPSQPCGLLRTQSLSDSDH